MTLNSMSTLYVYFIVYAIAQGIMDAYEEAIETPYLLGACISISRVGIIQTIDFIPWCIKFVWALPSDSYNFMGYGHRRPYVVLGLGVAAFAFGCLSTFNPKPDAAQVLYCFLMITRNIGIAVADCAVDGLSVDAEIDQESGALSGWMSLGRTFGTVLCCVVAGQISLVVGYPAGILASACFVFIPLPANWFIVEEWDDQKAYADKLEDAAMTAALNTPTSPSMRMLIEDSPSFRAAEGGVKGSSGGSSGGGGGSSGGDSSPRPGASSSVDLPRPLLPGGVSFKQVPEWVDPVEVYAARRLQRRPSFVGKVAAAVGFDWDLLGELVSQTHVWMFLLYICLTTLGVAIANFSLAAWLEQDHHFKADDIGNIMAVMSVGCFVVSLPLGYLFDYIPYKRSMMFGAAAICALCNLALAFCETPAQLYMGLFGFGAAHGAIFVVQCSMARILADSRISAVFFGIVNSACNLMHALGTAITGFIVGGACKDFGSKAPDIFCPGEVEHECLPMQLPGGGIEYREYKYDYILSFYIAAAIDALAVIFVFFISAEKFNLDLAEGGTMRVLPHRKALKLATLRNTALNHTAEQLSREGGRGGFVVDAGESSASPLAFSWDSGATNVFSSPLSSAVASRKAAEAAAARAAAAEDAARTNVTLVGGVPMSTPLAAFLARSSSGVPGPSYYAPAGQAPHVVTPDTASSSRAFQTFFPADVTADERDRRAPRPPPAPPGDARRAWRR